MANQNQRQSIIDTISELEALVQEMDEAENAFQPEDMVNYSHEGQQGVAMIESAGEGQYTVRVYAVSGENYEPTDDVLVLPEDQISAMSADSGESNESEDSDEDEENEAPEKGSYVQWFSKYGLTCGRVVDLADADKVIIPETGDEFVASKAKPIALIEVYQDNGGFEDTGVHVALPVKSLEVIDPLNVKPKKLLVKVKNIEIVEDSENKVGWLNGVGGAYGKVDLGGDHVSKGAYTQTIAHNEGKIQLSVDHGMRVKDVAGVTYLEDSEEGLVAKSKMPLHIPHVKQAYDIAKFMIAEGKPLGYSIEYRPVKAEPMSNGIRNLKEIALEGITITPWPMDTHARIRDAKDRKFAYNSKRRGWSQLQTKSTDAPTGNQDHKGDYKLLGDMINEIKSQMEKSHV